MEDYSSLNEWQLAIKQQKALEVEDYETCFLVKQEVDSRIKNGTINHVLMQGFRYWNPRTNKFEGMEDYKNTNSLFKDYKPIK